MSHRLAILLGKTSGDFERLVQAVETTIDGQAIDVALLGEIAQKAAEVKRHMLLDPNDTTAAELYHMLLGRIREDNQTLARVLRGEHANAVSEMSPLIMRSLQAASKSYECFAIKSVVLKRLLKANPPRETMKHLHYRSLASLLKHEQPETLVVLARYLEDYAWQDRHADALAAVSPSDMVSRPLIVARLDKAVLVKALEPTIRRHHLLLHAKEAGIVALAPTNQKVIECYTIRTVALMAYYVQELRNLNTLGKLLISQSEFGKRYADAVARDHDNHIQIAGYPVNWRSLHHAVAEHGGHEAFEPSVSKHDWQYQPVNDALSQSFLPHSLWWRGMSGAVIPYDQPLSGNILDVAIDASYNTSFGDHSLKYVRRELEHELLSRYLSHPRVLTVVLHRLNII